MFELWIVDNGGFGESAVGMVEILLRLGSETESMKINLNSRLL